MSTAHPGGGASPATGGHEQSPFGIYRNALDFVMNTLSLDEETAARVILNEMGPYANEWERFGIHTAAGEVGARRAPPQAIDWRQAWLN